MTILSVTGFSISLHSGTDSTIVLQWLAQLPKTWTTFVANRVSQIQATLPRSIWRHVPSLDNPADLASRSCVASHLSKSWLCWLVPIGLARRTVSGLIARSLTRIFQRNAQGLSCWCVPLLQQRVFSMMKTQLTDIHQKRPNSRYLSL